VNLDDVNVLASAIGIVNGQVRQAEDKLAGWQRVRENREKLGLKLTLEEAIEREACEAVNVQVWTYIRKAIAEKGMADALGFAEASLAVAVPEVPSEPR
jgi:hypothetical protein